ARIRLRTGATVNSSGFAPSAGRDLPLQQGTQRGGQSVELIRLLQHGEAVRAADLLAVAGRQQDRQFGKAVADLVGKLTAADPAADLLGDAEHLAEAEAVSLAIALGGEERLEHPLHHLGGHAGTGIGNLDRDMLAREALGLALKDDIVRTDL